MTGCNAQANDKTIEEELDALLLDLDSGGRRIEMVEHVLGATVDSKLLQVINYIAGLYNILIANED